MKQRPTVTYIKAGIEETITLNVFNTQKILNKLVQIDKRYFGEELTLRPQSDVEVIYLKNFVFESNTTLEFETNYFNKNVILILENCIFVANRLKIETKNIEIINPHFLKSCEIYVEDVDFINLVLSEETKDIHLEAFDCKTLLLTAAPSLRKVKISWCQNIHIKNLNNLNNSYINCSEKLALENSNLKIFPNAKIITLKNSQIEVSNIITPIPEILTLQNSSIIAEEEIFLLSLKLEFKDEKTNKDLSPSTLQAGTSIQIGDKRLINQEVDKPLIISEDSLKTNIHLVRQNLLFTLKKLREQINENVEQSLEERKGILTSEIKKYQKDRELELTKEIEKRKEQIAKEVDYQNDRANTKLNKTEKYLLTKEVSTYIKKDKPLTSETEEQKQDKKLEFKKEIARRRALEKKK